MIQIRHHLDLLKHGGGNIMIGAVFLLKAQDDYNALSGQWMDHKIFDKKIPPSASTLKMDLGWVHVWDPKPTSKATKECLKKTHIKVMQLPSLSPDSRELKS